MQDMRLQSASAVPICGMAMEGKEINQAHIWMVTTYRADDTVRDVAVFRTITEAQARELFYAAQGFRSEITGPAEMQAAAERTLAAKNSGLMRWGRPPLSGPEWEEAWENGPGGEP